MKHTEVKSSVQPIDCSHYINGKYVKSGNGETFENINPATEEKLGDVHMGSKEDIDQAVGVARKALKGEWKDMPAKKQSRILRKIGDLSVERQEELRTLETPETGKPICLSRSIVTGRVAH